MVDKKTLQFDTPPAGGAVVPGEAEVMEAVEAELGLDILSRFGNKSRGRRPSKPPLHFEYCRDLVPDDALAWERAPVRQVGETGGTPTLQKIRTVHHQVARMMASGTKLVTISAVLGLTPARLQQLKNDPTFMELLQHYENLEEQAEISLRDRFYLLGTAGMEELQERLLEEPDSFGNAHLMELVKLTVGGEAPRAPDPGKKQARVLSPEDLENLKKQADASSRTQISYRTNKEEDSGNGKVESN
jgi:hypothetical protein